MVRRTVSIFLGVLLTLIVIASVGLWIQSYPGQIHTRWNWGTRHCHFDSYGGKVNLQWMNAPSGTTLLHLPKLNFQIKPTDKPSELFAQLSILPLPRGTFGLTIWGGDFKALDPSSTWSYRIVSVKWWLITTAFSLLWVIWLATGFKALARRRRRLARGRCRRCGYDLRAMPEADGAIVDCCPECGMPS